MNYNFYNKLTKIHNSGQSHSVVLCGNIYDLFYDGKQYVPLTQYLLAKTKTDNIIQIVYEINGPIRVVSGLNKLQAGWAAWKTKPELGWADLSVSEMLSKAAEKIKPKDPIEDLNDKLDILGKPAVSLEILRQLTICSRKHIKNSNLMILIEGADMIMPAGDGDISRLNDAQLQRIAIMQDWLQDPEFVQGGDTVCFIAESASLMHSRVVRLPQVLSVEIAAPDYEQRKHFIDSSGQSNDEVAANTAGLSLYALRQLLAEAAHDNKPLTAESTIDKVESFIKSQVGDDVVEFKKPMHRLKDCVGSTNLKKFLENEFIPRIKAEKDACISGAGVSGPIGGGKTFLFEAVAGELGMPVLVIKNMRSQWYGQTDVIFERLRRVLEALEKVCVFADEADTLFGSVSSEEHSTERRLTGKIQGMMSDPKLKGKVIWLLMTARIHLLSPDIRRPGRVGDLIIPVLDPEGTDRTDFVKWSVGGNFDNNQIEEIVRMTEDYSAAAYASLRSFLKSKKAMNKQDTTFDDVKNTICDLIPADIGKTRRYQELQALVNCTRKSLLPQQYQNGNISELRDKWIAEIKELELEGIR